MIITACEEQEEHTLQGGIDEQDIESMSSEEELQTAYDELDLISIEANENMDSDKNPGGRVQTDEPDRFTRCASVTHDKEAMTITIDFGDGCEGPDGKVRSGIIYITYTGRLLIPGSVWTITSRGYTDVEGVANGLTRRGIAYVSTNISTIIWKRVCRLRGVCIPVQGLKLVERRALPDILLDFGDGQCDTQVTITKNGQSRVIEKDC